MSNPLGSLELVYIDGYLSRTGNAFYGPEELYAVYPTQCAYSIESSVYSQVHTMEVTFRSRSNPNVPRPLQLSPGFARALDKIPIEDIARYLTHRIDKGPTSV